jgi:hypothetical protein
MVDETLIQEVRELKRVLAYAIWSLGASLALRQPIDLGTESGRQIGIAALNGFAALMTLIEEEFGQVGAEKTPSWLQ